MTSLPNCPECFAREKKAIQAKFVDKEGIDVNEINALIDKIEIPMKMDLSTKHFICKRCGLYATREQLGDIRERLNRKDQTREDKQYDYLDWWQKSKKEKQKV